MVCASMRGPSIWTVPPGFVATVCGKCTTDGLLPTVATDVAVVVVTVDVGPLPAGNNLIIFLGILLPTPAAVVVVDPAGELMTMGFLIATFLLGVAATCTVCSPVGVDTNMGVVFLAGLKV